jgi:hypothetical protein
MFDKSMFDKNILNSMVKAKAEVKMLPSPPSTPSISPSVSQLNSDIKAIHDEMTVLIRAKKLTSNNVDIEFVNTVNNLVEMYNVSGNVCILEEIDLVLDKWIDSFDE